MSGVDGYDVYISYEHSDVAWAKRLSQDLESRGIRCFSDLKVSAGEVLGETMDQALNDVGALVVLWSAAAVGSAEVLREITIFDTLRRHSKQQRLAIPVLLGGPVLFSDAPDILVSSRALFISRRVYAEGPEVESDEWMQAVATIENAVRSVMGPKQPPELYPAPSLFDQAGLAAPPAFSRGARLALTLAVAMLGDYYTDTAHLRTAALLGAMQVLLLDGMPPPTGDVVGLVLERQPDDRTAEEAFDGARAAVGLAPVPPDPGYAMDIETLLRSSARELVRAAIEVQHQTGATGVRLRHVLAAGMHSAVPSDALAPLGVTMPELRARWRASLARNWPAVWSSESWEEPQASWEDLLSDAILDGRGAASPPSARVHADRWTTEDRLDYALYAKAIAEFIRHPDAKPPMVISVQAPWGQGKTSLMRMVQKDLDSGHPDFARARGDGEEQSAAVEPPSELTFGELRDSLDGTVRISDTKPEAIRTVWFNAWKYQSSEQIWAGLAHAILTQLPARLSAKDRELFWLRLQLRRIDPSSVRNDIHKAVLERFLPQLAGWVVLALGALIVLGLTLLAGGLGALGVGITGGSVLGAAWVAQQAWAAATKEVLERRLEGTYLRYVRQPDYTSKLGYLHLVEEELGSGARFADTRQQAGGDLHRRSRSMLPYKDRRSHRGSQSLPGR